MRLPKRERENKQEVKRRNDEAVRHVTGRLAARSRYESTSLKRTARRIRRTKNEERREKERRGGRRVREEENTDRKE